MKTKLFSYNVGNTVIHRMSGGTKFLCFVMTSLAAMLTYDIRVLLFIALFSYSLLPVAKITWKQIRGLMYYFFAFLWLNVLLTYLFSPEAGVEMFGTRTLLLTITSRYTITVEQLLYQFAKAMKYIAVNPHGHDLYFHDRVQRVCGFPVHSGHHLQDFLRRIPDASLFPRRTAGLSDHQLCPAGPGTGDVQEGKAA